MNMMKSKKIIAALLAAGMTLSFVACAEGDPSSSSGESSVPSSQNSSSSPTPESSEGSGGSSSPEVKSTQVFGKVKSVAGNEITLNLANMPDVDMETDVGEGSGEGQGGITVEGGGAGVAAIKSETVTIAEDAGGGEKISGGEIQRSNTELEYTGEEQDFIIPAGAKIYGVSGADEAMDAIKKGSILMMNLDENGNIVSVSIWE